MSMWIKFILFILSLIYAQNSDFYSLLLGSIAMGKHSTAIPSIDNCLFPPQCWIYINISLTLYIYFWWIITEKIISSLLTFHRTKITDMRNMKWQFFHCGNVFFFFEYVYNFLGKNKTFLHHLFHILSLSGLSSHNSQIFLYLNGLNPCIEHLDMFWNKWNFILWRQLGKKKSSCYDDSKYGAFILGQSEQQLKIQFRFGIFDTVIGYGKLYDDVESHALKYICELFGNTWFFY